ncbi:MAG: hypoxanthine phosphoribosyltransferase [Methanonatronarchaeia archaeon]|nr:MAG: hypoxanthine phosphoribosyltransferase [Methanonatronarchaeia archaeon]
MDKELMHSESEIKEKVKKIAVEITRDYRNTNPLMIGVLKGSFIFISDLIREIEIPLEVDFVDVKSYYGTESTEPQIEMNTTQKIADRHIILVDDILDTGKTMDLLKSEFNSRGARSVTICTLLDKPTRRKIDIKPDYKGFEIPDAFVVGYGLDYNEKYRGLPEIYRIDE